MKSLRMDGNEEYHRLENEIAAEIEKNRNNP